MPRSADQGLPVGVPLLTALLRDMTPEQRRRLGEYGERATRVMDFLPGDEDGSWYFRFRYEKVFEKKLESGELIGTGILLPADARRPRRIIPAELWEFGYKHYERSSLILDKKEFVKIEVFPASELLAWKTRGAAERNSTEMGASASAQPDITFSQDGVLKIGLVTMLFKGPKQRRLVELLIRNYRSGTPCKVASLLEDAGFSPNVDTLIKAFGKNRSWPKLDRHIIRENGFVLLQTGAV